MIYSIFACDSLGGFGVDDTLPWPLIEYDMENFVSNTLRRVVVMGYNAFKSLVYPLENRLIIVVQNRTQDRLEELCDNTLFITFPELEILLKKASGHDTNHVFILGGVQIIESCIEYIDELFIVHILGHYDCNIYINIAKMKDKFPVISFKSKVYNSNSCLYFFEIRGLDRNNQE